MAVSLFVLSGSQAVQRCAPSAVHLGAAQEQPTPCIESHRSDIFLCLCPHTWGHLQVARRPVSGTGGSSETLVQCLVAVSWGQLEFVL